MDYLLPTAVETPAWEVGEDRHPVAAPPDRRQGRRRVGHGRRAAGDRQRGRRRAVAPRGPQHRHPDHPAQGLADPARQGRRPSRCPGAACAAAPGGARGGRGGVRDRDGRRGPPAHVRASPARGGSSTRTARSRAGSAASCAQPVVVREALRSLQDGQPRLLRLSKDAAGRGPPGRRDRRAGHEPATRGARWRSTWSRIVPAPALWIAGTTPIAAALAALGAATGWRVSVFDPVAEADAFPGAERVSQETGLRIVDPERARTWSSRPRGSGTRRRCPAAAAPGPRRVRGARRVADPGGRRPGLAARRGRPRGAGRRPARARRHRPRRGDARGGRALDPRRAGPGPPRPRAVRGDARARRRSPGRRPAPPAARSSPAPDDIVLVDPVCGMTVDRAHARHLAEHDGVVYAFCRMGCRTAFIREPAAYVGTRRLDRRPTLTSPPEAPHAVPGHRRDRGPPRQGLGVPDRPQPGRAVRPGRRVDRGHRRGPLQGQGQGGHRLHQRPVHRST